MIELGALLLFGGAALALIVSLALVLKAVLWVVLLPVRLLFWILGALLFLPWLLLKAAAGGLLFLLAVPLLLVGAVIAAVVLAAAVLLPAIPLVFLAALVYYLLRPEPGALART